MDLVSIGDSFVFGGDQGILGLPESGLVALKEDRHRGEECQDSVPHEEQSLRSIGLVAIVWLGLLPPVVGCERCNDEELSQERHPRVT